MLDAWLWVPLPLRLALLVLIGLVVGSFANLAIYSLVFREPRPISPWSPVRSDSGLARRWLDYVPVIGWLHLRRESTHFGKLHWVRPLLIELACGLSLATLYWWETDLLALLPNPIPNAALVSHSQFIAHALLFALLLIATFTDFDDKTIPDMVIVPGTIAGLLLTSLWPDTMLLTVNDRTFMVNDYMFTSRIEHLYANPSPFPKWTSGIEGLLVALSILGAWSFALMNKMCTLRKGWRKGIEFFFVSLVRYRSWVVHVPLLLLMGLYTVWIWHGGGIHWQALLTSIIGMGVGGLIVWSVRIVGGFAFGAEAMGFGDVILLAMIGSFLGWQAAILTFFMSTLSPLVVGTVQWLTTGENRLAFGPYLSFAALVLVVGWNPIWNDWLSRLFASGLLVAAVLIGSLPILGALMWIMRQIRNLRGV